MHTILAQLPTATPTEIGAWLVSAAAVLHMVKLGKETLIRKPSLGEEFVSKKEFSEFQKSTSETLESIRLSITREFKDYRVEQRSRDQEVFGRIVGVEKQTAALSAKLDMIINQGARHDAKR